MVSFLDSFFGSLKLVHDVYAYIRIYQLIQSLENGYIYQEDNIYIQIYCFKVVSRVWYLFLTKDVFLQMFEVTYPQSHL